MFQSRKGRQFHALGVARNNTRSIPRFHHFRQRKETLEGSSRLAVRAHSANTPASRQNVSKASLASSIGMAPLMAPFSAFSAKSKNGLRLFRGQDPRNCTASGTDLISRRGKSVSLTHMVGVSSIRTNARAQRRLRQRARVSLRLRQKPARIFLPSRQFASHTAFGCALGRAGDTDAMLSCKI